MAMPAAVAAVRSQWACATIFDVLSSTRVRGLVVPHVPACARVCSRRRSLVCVVLVQLTVDAFSVDPVPNAQDETVRRCFKEPSV